MISKNDVSVATLNRLKEKGHTLLIDDFGMGHTSLLYLQSGYFGVYRNFPCEGVDASFLIRKGCEVR